MKNQFALWDIAFRPFYFGAMLYSIVTLNLWSLQWIGTFKLLQPLTPLWHAHEMLFGYGLAIVVGFLLTAGQTWTSTRTINGRALAILFVMWLVARVSVLMSYFFVSVVANTLFLLMAAIALAVPLIRSKSRRNYLFPAALLIFATATFVVHAQQLGWLSVPGWIGIEVALGLTLVIMVIMTGRVVPLFSNNGIPGLDASRNSWAESVAVVSVFSLLLADIFQLDGKFITTIAGIATISVAYRLVLWRSFRTLNVPLVGVLHLGCCAIVLHLLCRAIAASTQLINSSTATHLLTVGALGMLTFGMVVRTTRGHLGLPLIASKADTCIFGFIFAAALARVLLPIIYTSSYSLAIVISSSCWSAAALVYLIQYGRQLCQPKRLSILS